MSEEKIVYPFDIKLLLFKYSVLLFFKNQSAAIRTLDKSVFCIYPNNKITRVLTSSTLAHKANIFLLPFTCIN